ncbi:hypothetical protein KKG22_02865 [Patescibacteria group bacterium]|nr:hypothetical protein [Patescibacteria group bacterium]MBU1721477.1 hypothetical protein [Patescibacteria group bacterium]MBU1900756.1 hypothetical protein [Patescibacteria group bacterium]
MLTDRQLQIFQFVIEQYIKTAEPIGSKFLAESGVFDIREATIRNELRALEEAGYLTHPHTSAGRIPTESGYRFFVEELLVLKEIGNKAQEEFDIIAKSEYDKQQKQKFFAKYLAEVSGTAIIVVFDRNSMYYTGFSSLFSEPEFREYEKALSVSAIFDKCESCLETLKKEKEKGKYYLIGKENPLSEHCSTLLGSFGENGLFLLTGPMRMDYGRNISYLNKILGLIE